MTIDLGLQAYHIHDGHVYHIWWQRWHYMARAVELGYRALSLDSDLSLRVDPYDILHGALRSHELVVAIDSARSGAQLMRFFPAINVGFVYCRDRAGGAAHRVLTEVAGSFERLLCAAGRGSELMTLQPATPLLSPSSLKSGASQHAGRVAYERVQQVLWEQDTFSDVVETAAFGLTGPEAHRHTLAHIKRNLTIEERARRRDWVRTMSSEWAPGAPPAEMIQLQLGSPTDSSSGHGGMEAGVGGDAGHRAMATVGGLPKWYLSAFAACPYGNACDGRWARTPTPMGIAHMVGERGKFVLMRLFGWWDYRVDLHPFVPQRLAELSHTASGLPANGGLPPGAASTLAAADTGVDPAIPRVRSFVFPSSVRVLVLRGSSAALAIGRGGTLRPAQLFAILSRWAVVALALGRRLVLPFVPCDLDRARSLRKPLNSVASVIKLDAPELCDGSASDDPFWAAPPSSPLRHASPSARVQLQLQQFAGGGRRLRGIGKSGGGGRGRRTDSGGDAKRGARRGCCSLLLRPAKCVDEFGTRRMLHEEMLFVERDLSRLESEAATMPAPSTRPTPNQTGESAELPPWLEPRGIVHIASAVPLSATRNGTASMQSSALLSALRHEARVLVADLRGSAIELPSTRALERAARSTTTFKVLHDGLEGHSGMPHAKGCLKSLASYDGLVDQAVAGSR